MTRPPQSEQGSEFQGKGLAGKTGHLFIAGAQLLQSQPAPLCPPARPSANSGHLVHVYGLR